MMSNMDWRLVPIQRLYTKDKKLEIVIELVGAKSDGITIHDCRLGKREENVKYESSNYGKWREEY